jgi:hypothetical protein
MNSLTRLTCSILSLAVALLICDSICSNFQIEEYGISPPPCFRVKLESSFGFHQKQRISHVLLQGYGMYELCVSVFKYRPRCLVLTEQLVDQEGS